MAVILLPLVNPAIIPDVPEPVSDPPLLHPVQVPVTVMFWTVAEVPSNVKALVPLIRPLALKRTVEEAIP